MGVTHLSNLASPDGEQKWRGFRRVLCKTSGTASCRAKMFLTELRQVKYDSYRT